MKVKVLKKFNDLKDGKRREKDDVFEVSEERFEQINGTKYGRLVGKVTETPEPDEGGSDDESLTAADIKKMNKGPQEEKIKELGGDPAEAKNEEERINLILQLQEQKEKESNENPPSEQ